MKKIFTTSLFFLAGILISSGLSAQCTPGFTWTQSSANTIDFTNTSSPINSTTVFYWNFGDNQFSGQQNPTNVYNTPGLYMVCLFMYDSLSGCQAQFCDTIAVTGNVICNMAAVGQIGQQPSCSTCADGVAGVLASNGTAPYTYAWNTGATSQFITGLLPGTYWVCVTDANNCVACDTIVLNAQQAGGCNASFTYQQTGFDQWTFTNTSTGTTQLTMYSWSFGDNGTSSAASPQHTYIANGDYSVCLTITVIDSMQNVCTSTYCDSVQVIVAGVSELTKANWKIFPNPAQDHITIQSGEAVRGQEFRILDITGKEISHGKMDTNDLDIHLLDAGVYLLELKTVHEVRSVQRFVKN